MGEITRRPGAAQHRIDDEAMGIFVTAVKRGAPLEDAARAASRRRPSSGTRN